MAGTFKIDVNNASDHNPHAIEIGHGIIKGAWAPAE